MKKILTMLVISMTVLTATGCYGSFGLTKKVYKFHGSIGDKWINSLIMFLVGHVVYGTTAFVDAVFLNAIEFWTGSNPVASGDTLEQVDEHGNKVLAVKRPDGSLDLTMTSAEGHVTEMTLISNEEMIQALDNQGKIIARVDMNAQ